MGRRYKQNSTRQCIRSTTLCNIHKRSHRLLWTIFWYLFICGYAKLFHHVLHPGDQQILQKRINELVEWTQRWLLSLNTKKYLVVSFARDVNKDSVYTIPHKVQESVIIESRNTVRDLGVIFDEKLTFRDHIHCKINMAYKMVGLIKRNFKYLSISSFVLVYKNLVRSQLDYCNSVWTPYRKSDIEAL